MLDGRRRKREPEDLMLANLLKAKTPKEKREVIKTFSPYHFAFGTKLNPNNPYKENEDESNTSKTNPANQQGQGETHATV